MKRTGRTETSKYPEEKKSTEIPKVAASEIGLALKLYMRQAKVLERTAKQGDSPVAVSVYSVKSSKAGHVISCLNMGGPSSKAKYSWLTDSEPVPWGKGEKNPCEGSEIEPETVYVQAVGASFVGWLRTFCIMGQRLIFSGKVNQLGEP